MAATVKSLAAAWMAKGDNARAQGSRSPAHELARRTGASLGAARQSIEVGQRLAHQPLVNAAARRGELSPAQAALVSDAVGADPSAEAKLVSTAALGSLAELRERCAQTKANAEPDLEARRRRIHSLRHLRTYTDPEGMWHLRAQGNPEHGAQVMSALGPIADQIFAQARAEGRREPADAYAFDALVCLANSAGWEVRRRPRVRRAAPEWAVAGKVIPDKVVPTPPAGASVPVRPAPTRPALTPAPARLAVKRLVPAGPGPPVPAGPR